MPYTRVLPEVTISELTPRKRRFFLKYLARFLLLFETVKAKGSFLDNKRVIITAAPHQSSKDEYLMVCLLYTSPSPRDGLLSRMPSSA